MIWCGQGWIHLYFLPSLREVSQDDSLSWKIFPVIIHIQEGVSVWPTQYTHTTDSSVLSLPRPFTTPLPLSLSLPPPSFPLFAGSKVSTNVTQMNFHSSAVGLTHGNNFRYGHAQKMNVSSGGSRHTRDRHNRSGVGIVGTRR